MGRIAEALKRAQEERSRRAANEPETSIGQMDARAPSSPSSGGRITSREGEPDVLSQATILETPYRPKPFPLNTSPILADSIDPRAVVFHTPTTSIVEKYRSVRTRLLTNNPSGGPRVFVITSSLRGEGKTVTTMNMGFAFAELRHLRVVMVDLDFRQRGLSSMLNVADKPGVAEVLRGEKKLADVCLSVAQGNLYFVPAGNHGQANPGELLAVTRTKTLFKEFKERFHCGFVDTPPITTVADVGLVAPLCHSALMVIRMNWTPEPVVRSSVQKLQDNQIPIEGSILVGHCEREIFSGDDQEFPGEML